MENKENFSYTYSARQQKEVEAIRNKYMPREEDKMAQLRSLHAIPTRKAQAASLVVGVIGALIMGAGMSLTMTDIGAAIGMNRHNSILIGIAVGLAGMVPVALAYPVYNRVLSRQRKKIAPQILKLSEELLK